MRMAAASKSKSRLLNSLLLRASRCCQVGMESPRVRNFSVGVNPMRKDIPKVVGNNAPEASLFRGWHIRERTVSVQPRHGAYHVHPLLTRSFASSSVSQSSGQAEQQHRKDISTYEDPFDAPTYNIPEKPVTYVEGASYSVVILAGLGVAAAAIYSTCTEILITPKEYKIFGKALKRVQNDSKVKERLGTPIKGYGRHIPHEIWTDEEGVERVKIQFVVEGPNGAADVLAEMFKDKEGKEWKYTVLLVQLRTQQSRRPVQLLLESYLPKSVPT